MALMRLDRTKSWEAILTSLARSALRPGELARRRRHERLDEIEVETSTDPAPTPTIAYDTEVGTVVALRQLTLRMVTTMRSEYAQASWQDA